MTNTTLPTTRRAGIPRRLLPHLRRNVVAYLALFFALGSATAMAAGTIGASQLKPLIVRGSNFVSVNPGTSAPASQSCKKGEKFISGAAWFPGLSSGDETRVESTQFIGALDHQPTGYLAYGYNNTSEPRLFEVLIACLRN
jgi:hypothetical protein